jgi:hypothetical protein
LADGCLELPPNQSGAECGALSNKGKQLLQAFQALTPDERNALLQALSHDEGA